MNAILHLHALSLSKVYLNISDYDILRKQLTNLYINFSLSGLSPFAGEDDLETLQNVRTGDWDFDTDAFSNVSDEGKDFIKKLLVKQPQYVHYMFDSIYVFKTEILSLLYILLLQSAKDFYFLVCQ